MYSQKRFIQASLLILTKYFQPFRCQHRDLGNLSKGNYEITEVHEMHVSILQLPKKFLESVISFSMVYIWDLGFGIEVWLIRFGIM